MAIQKVMEILNEFEVKAVKDINLDKVINADPYESVGRHKLIRKIKKRISKAMGINHQEVS